jgi:hypothetical protein
VVQHDLLEAVEIVENVGRAQELQQSKAGVSSQVDERDRVPTDRNLTDDETDLRERRIRQRRLDVALHARGNSREYCRYRSKYTGQETGCRRLFE